MPKLDSKIKPGDVLPKRYVDPAFGDAVRSARKALGISLSDMSQRVGICTAYLSQIERAIFPPPRAEIVVALANELGLNPSELLGKAGMTDLTVVELFRAHPELITEMQEAFAGIPDRGKRALLPIISEQLVLEILKISLRGSRPTEEQWEGLRNLVFGPASPQDAQPPETRPSTKDSPAPPRKTRGKP
jgi:transcriptional regulator with XRE-family HTH domain